MNSFKLENSRFSISSYILLNFTLTTKSGVLRFTSEMV